MAGHQALLSKPRMVVEGRGRSMPSVPEVVAEPLAQVQNLCSEEAAVAESDRKRCPAAVGVEVEGEPTALF